jgi:hypothetical protein
VSDRGQIQRECRRVPGDFMAALNNYVLTKVDGRRGIRARSSFGPG